MTMNFAVDDSESMRLLMSDTLKDAGFDEFTAVDGEDTLNMAKSSRTEILVTAINKPTKSNEC